MTSQELREKLLKRCALDASGLQKRLEIVADTSNIVRELIAIICSQREALEFVYKKSDPFMPCEDDWDASDPLHCVVMNSMDALADTDARLKSMGVL